MADLASYLTGNVYWTAPSNTAYNFGMNPFTLELWFKTTTPGVLISRKSSPSLLEGQGFMLTLESDGSFTLTAGNGTTYNQFRARTGSWSGWDNLPNLFDDNWHFVSIARLASGNYNLLLDGQYYSGMYTSNSSTYSVDVDSTAPLLLGAAGDSATNDNFFTGCIDEIRIWNLERTSQQMLEYMNTSLTGTEPGLVGYYTFSNGNGTDSSPTANYASPSGYMQWVTPGAPMGTTSPPSSPPSTPPPSTTGTMIINIPTNTLITLGAISNSAYYQRLTITVPGLSGLVLSGTGENVVMTTSAGANTINFNSGSNTQMTLLFQYSRSGPNGNYYNSKVSTPSQTQNGSSVITTVGSEDSGDNDYNDTALTIYWSVPV